MAKTRMEYTLDLTNMGDLTEFLRKIQEVNGNVVAIVGDKSVDAKQIENMASITKDYPVTVSMESDDTIALVQFRQVCGPYEVHEGACEC